MIDIDYLEFKLGEKEYHIPACGLKRSEIWRARFQQEAQAILAVIRESGVEVDLSNMGDISNIDIIELLPIIERLFTQVNISMTGIIDLIADYNDKLIQDIDYIGESATVKQAIFALWGMIKTEYPFWEIFRGQPSPPNGQADGMTLKNSLSASGGFSQTPSTTSTPAPSSDSPSPTSGDAAGSPIS